MTDEANKFRFLQTSAVAAGSFNTTIVHPAWLKQVEILPENIEPEVQIDFQQPGLRLNCKEHGMWVVRPDRLMIESADQDFVPGRTISQVIKLLPWTPVSAVGLNYRFEAKQLPVECKRRLAFPIEYENNHFEVAQRSWHVALKEPELPTVRNVQLSVSEEKIVLSVNFHTDTTHMAAEEILDHINRPGNSLKEAERLAMDVFSIDLS